MTRISTQPTHSLPAAPRARFDEAIVVLGAQLEPDLTLGPGLRSRLETTLKIAQQRPDAAVVVSGGGSRNAPEAHEMARWLLAHGVTGDRLVLEDRSATTRENAAFTVPLLSSLGVSRVAVVTEAFHMRRSRMLMSMVLRQQGLGDVKLECVRAPTRNLKAARREAPVPARDLRHQAKRWKTAPRPDLAGRVEAPRALVQGVAAALGRPDPRDLILPSRE
ncbi:MAG: YdcF family protein [Myxococcota bacterium]